MIHKLLKSLGILFFMIGCYSSAYTAEWVTLSGTVTYENEPLCTMVLANGQYMFSCGENNGLYEMDVPLNENGEITLFSFCDGFEPFKQILTPEEAINFDIKMSLVSPDCQKMSLTVEMTSASPGWVKITGKASYKPLYQRIPLSVMLLANGQHTFTNPEDGSYEIEAPLNQDGKVDLFGFCDGFVPYKICKYWMGDDNTPINFPDSNLEAEIRNAISKPEGDIIASDLQDLTVLYAVGKGIENLEGLQYCLNLTEVVFYSNQITDLTPLAELTNLTEINLNSNEINELSPLAGLINLNRLNLSSNEITDLSPLAKLINLNVLYLCSNKITDLSSLAELINLNVLNLGNSYIFFVRPVETEIELDIITLQRHLADNCLKLQSLYKKSSITTY